MRRRLCTTETAWRTASCPRHPDGTGFDQRSLVGAPGAAGWAVTLAVLVVMAAVPAIARADPGDVGYQDSSYSGPGTPTGTKRAESVLWWNDGSWWADMWDTVSQDFHIFRLDVPR